MTYWTVIYNGTEKAAADWRLNGFKLACQSQAADTLTFRAPGRDVDADPVFAFDATIELWRDRVAATDGFEGGRRFFVGRITRIPVSGTAAAEDHDYEAGNIWRDLEQTVYQQSWYTVANIGTPDQALVGNLTPRLNLFQGFAGGNLVKLTAGQQLADIIAYAVACGLPLQLGAHDIGLADPPVDQVVSISCAEAIQKCLRWCPDAVSWLDYATTPPTIHFMRRGDLPALSLDVSRPSNDDADQTRRPDLTITPRLDLPRRLWSCSTNLTTA